MMQGESQQKLMPLPPPLPIGPLNPPTEPARPRKVNKHLKRFFLGWQNPCAAELILLIVIVFAVTYIILGFVILGANSRAFDFAFDYTDYCRGQPLCLLPPIKIAADAKGPLFVRYRIDKFHQNHYKFRDSFPTSQFYDGKIDSDSNSNCGKYLTNAQMNKTIAVDGTPLEPNDVAVPCGVLAFAYFNDSFSIADTAPGSQPIPINFTDIAWPDDKEFKFKNVNFSRQWIDISDERFINWMRTSPYPYFVKLWGRIDVPIAGRTIQVRVNNTWPANRTKSRKYFVLSGADFYGTPNKNLVIFFLFFGFLALVFFFLLLYLWCYAARDKFFKSEDGTEIRAEETYPETEPHD